MRLKNASKRRRMVERSGFCILGFVKVPVLGWD